MVLFSVLPISLLFYGYQIFRAKDILHRAEHAEYVYVHEGEEFKTFHKRMVDRKVISNPIAFAFAAKLMKYQENMKPGKYLLEPNSTVVETIRLLRRGDQVPVKITFNNLRFKDQVPGRVCKGTVADSVEFLEMLNDKTFLNHYGFDTTTIGTMFIPDTYEVFWTYDAEDIFDRLNRAYKEFWNKERRAKAAAQNLTPIQATILASIVEEETKHVDEMPMVAGLYLNRLKKDWLLQADPTVKFALGDPTIRRVLTKDLATDSPYNTYLYKGLPPGPIRIPSIPAIKAVLNPKEHSFMYMCAKPGYDGYHNFARTSAEHGKNSRAYQKWLSQENIYR